MAVIEELRGYSWKEVAKHNTSKSAYIVVRNKVYDVTEWMKTHPGGADVLLVAAGRDVTHVFDSYHKPTTAIPDKFCVGYLTDSELPTFPEQSFFQKAVRSRVAAYFRDNKLDPKHVPWMWVRYAMLWTGIVVPWYLQLVLAPVSMTLTVICALILGLCCALLGLLPLHDGSHFANTHSPLVWRLLGATHDFLNGSSYLIWLYQHMLGHHPYTNIDGADPDIETAADGDIRRIKSGQPWYSRYLSQHVYVPLVYAFLGIKTRYQDIVILHVVKHNGAIRLNPPTTYHLLVFWLGKIFFIIYRFVIPSFYMPISTVLLLFLLSDAVSSYWLAVLFQANHVADDVDWPLPDDKGRINQDWAELQVSTTVDYGHKSWFWTVFSGSLNFQSTHHLFPGVSQYYYPMIAPIILGTCDEFGIRYRVKETVGEAVAGHVNHLYNLGRKAEAKKAL